LHTNISVQNFKEGTLKFTCEDKIKQNLITVGCQNIEWVQLAGLVTGTSSGLTWTLTWMFRFHISWWHSWLGQRLSAYVEGICSKTMETFKEVRTWDSILN